MTKRLLVSPAEMLAARPSAGRLDAAELLLRCEDATSQIFAWTGKRLFVGTRLCRVTPTGGYFATLPDPPIIEILEVKYLGDGDALDLETFKIEDPVAGTIWSAIGWQAFGFARVEGGELNRSESAGFPGGWAGEGPPVFWTVKYTSGTPAHARAKLLARELVMLRIDRDVRMGVIQETVGGVQRYFDFEKAELGIKQRARAMGVATGIR
jgi:hypothetical protein